MNMSTLAPLVPPVAAPGVETILTWLRGGKERAFVQQAHSLISQIGHRLGVKATPSTATERSARFVLERLDIAFRGFGGDHVHGLLLAGPDDTWRKTDSSFWSRVENPSQMPMIFACGEEEYHEACRRVGGHYALVLSPTDILDFFAASSSLHFLKGLLRRRFKRGALHPFEHQKPVFDVLFRGRDDLLQRLCDNPMTNFALVGPSKMGKTSLIRRYLALPSSRKTDSSRQIYVDLYDRAVTEIALVRAIRMAIDAGASAYYDPAETLSDFLAKARSRLGGPLEIILDETDGHLGLETLRVLIHLAVRGLCRLILIGRWRLMKTAMHTQDDNFNRLEPLVLPPLKIADAVVILEKPLNDLGYDLLGIRRELRSAVNRLGRVPGLIQELGAFLVEEGRETITVETLKRALNRVITTSRLLGLLKDLSSLQAQVAALLLALEFDQRPEVDPLFLLEQFRKKGIRVKVEDCMEICDELVIHHLLGLEDGVYRMACWDLIADGQNQRRLFEAMLAEKLADLGQVQSIS